MAKDPIAFQASLEKIKRNDRFTNELSLDSRELKHKDIIELTEALKHNTFINALYLYKNQIGPEGALALAYHTSISSLILWGNKIGDKGAQALAMNTTINYLDLHSNDIGDEGAIALAGGTSIISLNLSHNRIGDEGAKALGKNTSITRLNLRENKISHEGAQALAKSTSITSLNLFNNNICIKGVQAFVGNKILISLLTDISRHNGIAHGRQTNHEIFLMIWNNKEQLKRFFQASRLGQIDTMADMIEARVVSPYATHQEICQGQTALRQAIWDKQYPVAAYLVKNFPKLLSYRTGNLLPVQFAEKRADVEMIEILKTSAPTETPASTILTPTALPLAHEHIQLGDKIAEGGFGEVFRGTFQLAPVAIKRLLLKQLSERALREFQQEAQLMATLRHPHIITFFGFTKATPFYIVMEWMAKGSLFSLLHSEQDLSWPQRIQWGVEISLGLHFLHAFTPQILHRDLKSLNVLIGERDEAKLTDFGLAMANIRTTTKTITSKSPSKQAAETVGSLRWMAPEILGLKPKYTPASDIFALAMVLWELASREIPYGDAPAESIIRDAVKGGEREDIPDDCPEGFATIIQMAWAQEAAMRPSAEEVIKQLQAMQGKPSEDKPADSPPYSAATTIAQSRGYAMHTEGAPAPHSGADAASAGYYMGSQ